MVSFKLIVSAGLLIMGSLLVIDQQINLGQFVAAEIVILLIINSVEKLILSMETIYDVLTALEKMGLVTDLPLENHRGIEFNSLVNEKGISIGIKKLNFKYPEGKHSVLHDINVDIPSGSRVCISGYSGSGKSTIMQLIAGLYMDFDGHINYNNIPIGNINLESLRSYIGDSLHEEKLFKGTLYENIALGRPGASIQTVLEAAEKVFLSDFVQNLKDGFETQIDPEGKNLPGSIVTKIILARSIACKAKLLLITDHLGRLDPIERKKIMDYLVDPVHDWTLVIISNQPEIAASCDRVLVMEEGRIIHDAHYSSLLNEGLFYQVNTI
jgi:ABC-type bacteriocin/lantibiotic exporter with double-glycine peptidase domain